MQASTPRPLPREIAKYPTHEQVSSVMSVPALVLWDRELVLGLSLGTRAIRLSSARLQESVELRLGFGICTRASRIRFAWVMSLFVIFRWAKVSQSGQFCSQAGPVPPTSFH